MVDVAEEDYIAHIGIKRRSGRYPWGSGGDPYQRAKGFDAYVQELRDKGLKDSEIIGYIDKVVKQTDSHASFNSSDFRYGIAQSSELIRTQNQLEARKLKGKGMGPTAIGKQMGVRESTVRGWLESSERMQRNSIEATANRLKDRLGQIGKDEVLDVGKGQHLHIGISDTKLKQALASLKDEGFAVHEGIKVPQQGIKGQYTTLKVLARKGVSWVEAAAMVRANGLREMLDYSDDGGLTFHSPKLPPNSVSSKRVAVRYAEDGGSHMDGVIELRRGVPDLDLGENRYAQVRIAVDGTHYIKGMAMYADDLPPGVDMRFNTNKSSTTPGGKLGVMKPMEVNKQTGEIDQSNPFGSNTYPRMYTDKSGKEHQSLLNVVGSEKTGNIEGRWDQWSRSLSSQMLSKQPVSLASSQLRKTQKSKEDELAKIERLTNPVVRRKLLEEYADSADAAAVHLKAAAMDRQSTHVILPMNSMRPDEIYAPSYEHGEKVVLVRHPHGGPFEIPELTVNLRNQTAKRILGNAKDAVGIHHSVADQLSGADFDGDTVLVIPNPSGRVKSRKPFAELQNFDPKARYKIPDDDTTTPRMGKRQTQTEMGRISNLITDMSIHKAPDDEMIRAVKHSMVVIDAEKHGLDYKKSEQDHAISALRKTYQPGKKTGGASTLLSKAGGRIDVPQFKVPHGKAGINPKTGEIVRVPTNETTQKVTSRVSKRTGETTTKVTVVPKTTKIERAAYVKDARDLVSDKAQPMELLYAQHSNAMKALANKARLETLDIRSPEVSKAAAKVYAPEVESLTAKLRIAQRNAPYERQAQVVAGHLVKQRLDANPLLDDDEIKKVRGQSLEEARLITGAAKERIHITDREWEAIQARAVPHTKLSSILSNADMNRVKELATPHSRSSLTPGQVARARQLQALGRPMSQIADELGIPRSTIIDNLNR